MQMGLSPSRLCRVVCAVVLGASSLLGIAPAADAGDAAGRESSASRQLGESPVPVSTVRAELPAGAAPGYVVTRFVVGPGGDVVMATALAGDSRLQSAALDALRRWKFAPGRRGVTGIVSVGVGVPPHLPPQRLSPTVQQAPSVRGVVGGAVVLEIDVRSDGTVAAARAVAGADHLRAVAETALLNWRYPAQALPYRLTVSVAVESALGQPHD